MKVLVIGTDFYPKNSPRSHRTTQLVNELQKQNNEVTVLTIAKEDVVMDYLNMGVRIIDMKPHFFDTYFGDKLNIVKRLILKTMSVLGIVNFFYMPHFLYKHKVYKALRGLNNSFDLTISIAVPHSVHWGVSKAIEQNVFKTNKWVGDCGDPFIGNPFNKRANFFTKYENTFLKLADYISVPNQIAIDAYNDEYRKKFKIIPQGFNIEKDKTKLGKYKGNSIPTFSYSGNFYSGLRDPSELFDFLIKLELDYKFIVYTQYK